MNTEMRRSSRIQAAMKPRALYFLRSEWYNFKIHAWLQTSDDNNYWNDFRERLSLEYVIPSRIKYDEKFYANNFVLYILDADTLLHKSIYT